MENTVKKIAEDEIVRLLKNKDKTGIRILYRDYAHIVMGLVFKIVKIEDIAENIVQDTFVKVWQKIEDFNPSKGRFIAWVLGIARNQAIDMVRSKRFRNDSITDQMDKQTAYHPKFSTTLNIEQIGVREAVKKLDPKYYQLIELIYFGGYTQSEVAKELNLPLGTVKSRIRKAFSQLKILLT